MLHKMQVLSSWDVSYLVAAILSVVAIWVASWITYYSTSRGVRPTRWPLLGTVPDILLNFHHYYDWTTNILGASGGNFRIYGPKFSNFNYYMTIDPRNVEYILKDNFSNFPKGPDHREALHDVLGHGIVNADDDTWRIQRKAAGLQLSTSAHRAFFDAAIVSAANNKLIPVLEHFCTQAIHVDLQELLLRFSFDVMCHVVFGAADVGCLSVDWPRVPFAEAFEHAQDCCAVTFFVPTTWWKLIHRLKIGKRERGMPAAIRIMDVFVSDLIAARRKSLAPASPVSNDLLSCFMNMEQISAANASDDKFVKDMCMSFLLAGRDTSPVALSWFFWLVATHPDKEAKLVDEIDRAMAAANEILSREMLSKMSYLNAALSESLRLYPSAPFLIRSVLQDDVLPDGHCMNKDDKVAFNIYAMGRNESIWGVDCREFRPERWLNANKQGEVVHMSPFQYPVFSAGPRTCLGKDMAYFLMKAVVCSMLYRFKVVLVPGHVVTPKISAILYMKHGLLVTVKRRIPNGE